MWLRFNARSAPTTIIQCYAPTNVSKDEAKEEFYQQLYRVIREVPNRDMLVVMGDFNARVGNDTTNWKEVIGRHGIEEEATDNGQRMLQLCASSRLCVTGTFLEHRNVHKFTWYQRGLICIFYFNTFYFFKVFIRVFQFNRSQRVVILYINNILFFKFRGF